MTVIRIRINGIKVASENGASVAPSCFGNGTDFTSSGITIGGGNVFVADANNDRVQVFDLEGKFVRQFAVPVWERSSGNYPDVAYDETKKLIYVTSGKTNEVLVFDAEGRQIDSIRAAGDTAFSNPSSAVIQAEGKSRRLLIMNTGSSRVLKVDLETKK